MKIILPVFLLILCLGCSEGMHRPKVPADLINHDTMVLILHDVMLIESYIETKYQRVDRYFKSGRNSGRKILNAYHVTPDQFARSYEWYVAHEDQLTKIYAEVTERMNKEAAELSAKGIQPAKNLPQTGQPEMGNPLSR